VKEVFVDTSFIVARINRRDGLHERAVAAATRIRRARLVTTDFVLAEVLNFFSEQGTALRAAAVDTVEKWNADASVHVMPASRAAFAKALERYKQRGDKGYSLTDCHSMLVLEERGITEVLTSDEHFVQAGFQALLAEAEGAG
jgi:predicted nucleic acid-binding protein